LGDHALLQRAARELEKHKPMDKPE
jgi:hypothetical protein